tara:strand:+ start:17605 stop:19176 length:1572 start_codon:yes stop_codon:yes gene_type:complete
MQLPATLPDETLFSRYIRHMTILGMNEKDYLKRLFNKPRISIHPYLTIGTYRASQISEEAELQIFNEQTLGRLFSYFLPHHAADIFSGLRTNDGNKAFRACQLASVKESETLSIKYCSLCASQDIWQYGVSYWHRIHQIPGIEACPYHQVLLVHQDLPQRPQIEPGFLPESDMPARSCSLFSFKFAQYAQEFLISITNSIDSYDRNELINKLKDLGYVTKKNKFRRKKITSDIFSFASNLKHTDPELLPHSDHDYRYFSYLLSGKVSQHPFKYLLVGFWLNSFRNCSSESEYTSFEFISSKSDTIERTCISLLKQGTSMAEIYRQTGKSRSYLKLLSYRNQIHINTKQIKISYEVKEFIINMARKGFHRNAIAKQFDISTGSVEQIISSVDGLVQKRKRYKFESKRRKYKVQILRTMQSSPTALKQEIKQSCYAAFHWLYLHEKEWLNKTLPAPTKPIPASKVDWKKRDEILEPKVRRLMLKYSGCISRTKLDKEIGGHGWLIKMKHKLPLTLKVYYELAEKT